MSNMVVGLWLGVGREGEGGERRGERRRRGELVAFAFCFCIFVSLQLVATLDVVDSHVTAYLSGPDTTDGIVNATCLRHGVGSH